MKSPRLQVMTFMLALGLASTACGLSYTIDSSMFANMAIDKKIRLFDGENEVSIATDDLVQMRERIRDLRAEKRAASRQQDVAQREMDRDDNPDIAKHGTLAKKAWDLRQDYLDASIDWLHDRIDVQKTVILSARAKFELAKALLVKKDKLAGAEDLDVKDFEAQVKERADNAKAAFEELANQKPALQKIRSEWLKARDDLAATSLQSLGSAGADEVPIWESW